MGGEAAAVMYAAVYTHVNAQTSLKLRHKSLILKVDTHVLRHRQVQVSSPDGQKSSTSDTVLHQKLTRKR